MELFFELTVILSLTTIISFVLRLLKQPLITGYILAGILVGPHFLNLISSESTIELFSRIGISILLFIVGLNLNLKIIKDVGKVSLITGTGQVIFTSLIGYFLALTLDIPPIAALYTAIALTFSSTIIILKLLTDKGDVDRLYGRISIGFLIIQDIIATVILMVVSSLSSGPDLTPFTLNLFKGAILLTTIFLLSHFFITKIITFAAHSQELLFLFSLSYGLGLAALFAFTGFSIEIGALIAGVTLASTTFASEISSRLKPLRDFFIVLFFILLGSQISLAGTTELILPAIILSLFVLIGNPLIVIILMNLLGFNQRIGLLAGLTVAQISEFSLILATLGFNLGHIDRSILSLITLVGLITITGSTYLILYSNQLYRFLKKPLSLLAFRQPFQKDHLDHPIYNLILFGYDRVGEYFLDSFSKLKLPYLVVDFNPTTITTLQQKNIPNLYGDALDPEFLEQLNLKQTKLIVSTIPDYDTNLYLLKYFRRHSPKTAVILTAKTHEEAKLFYKHKATYVLMLHHLGSHLASEMITKLGLKKHSYKQERDKHLRHLKLH